MNRGIENTAFGKKIIKTAMEAEQQGKNISVVGSEYGETVTVDIVDKAVTPLPSVIEQELSKPKEVVEKPIKETVVEPGTRERPTTRVTAGQDIKDLDAQIRTIEEPTKDNSDWTVEIGLQESLGERGGDILTQSYDSEPTLEEVRKDIIEEYKRTKVEINEEVAIGITAKSGRDEMVEGAIDKVLTQEESVIKPTEAKTEEEVISEVKKVGLEDAGVLKFKTAGSGTQGAYRRPVVGRTELKIFVDNSPEFKVNPVFTVTKDKDLEFIGKKTKILIKPAALQVNPENLKVGEKIRVDVKSLKGTKAQQMRVSNSGGTYASIKEYADVESAQKTVENIKSVAFPELLRIARELTGKIPSLKRFPRAQGMFYSGGDGRIALNPEIFKNPVLAAKVFAHELGHLADYLPDKTLSRGNLLGRIASLKKYMKTMLEEFPDSEGGLITPEEKAKLRNRAKQMAEDNFEIVPKEVEIRKEPTSAKEILSIWNTNTAGIKSPELLAYIQSLSSKQKVEIVKNALRGTIPEWVTFKKSIKETITERVLRNSPEDIKKLYQKLLQEEIIARRLFDLGTIKKELQILTQKWAPYDANLAPPSYIKYRNSPSELYADAISVLFNDPTMLKEDAPTFWKAYFNYLDTKPRVKEVFEDMWNLLNQGQEEVFKARDEEMSKGFKRGEEAFAAKLLDQQKRGSSFIYHIKLLFDDKNTPIKEKINRFRKQGGDIPSELNPDYALKGLLYSDGELKNYINDNFQSVFAKAQEVNGGWDLVGKVLFYERVMNERGELANPQGYSPKEAAEQLAGMEKTMTPTEWATIQEAKDLLRTAVQKSLDVAETNEYYTPELLEQMKANPAYATFQVVDYLDTYITARVYQQKGTLKDIANPATSTVMKLISLHKAIKRNNAKKLNVGFIETNFSPDIEKARTSWNGKTMEIKDPKDSDTGLVITIEKGKPQGYYVEKDVADMLNHSSNSTIEAVARISRVISQSGFYRPLFTMYNLGFQSFNVVRDIRRTWRNYPHSKLSEIPLAPIFDAYKVGSGYLKALGPSARRVKNMPDTIIQEMENANILGLTYNDMYSGEVDPEAKQIERIFEKTGILTKEKKRNILTPFVWALDKVAVMGDFIETLPKVAGYIELKGKMPERELAEFVRTSIGSPAFRVQGLATPITNSIFLFSNAIKEGIKTDIQVGIGKKGKVTAAGFWYKTVIGDFLPKFMMAAIAAGLLGDELKKIMDKQSEYDKTNYTIIPLGTDENGEGIILRIPHDETGRFLSGLLWKAININKDGASVQDVFDVFSFGAGQLPNLSPSFVGAGAVLSYISGNNPYDSFRNRNVIPDTEFKAGPKYSLSIFLDWLAKNQGLGILFPSYQPDDPTDLQKVLNAPVLSNILGRWVKTSDFGETERLREVAGEAERVRSGRLLEERKLMDQAIKEYKENPGRKNELERQLVKDIVLDGDNTKETNTKKKFRLGILRGESDPQINSLIDANTNVEKEAIFQELKNTLSDDEFRDILKTAKDNKIISDEVLKKVRKMQKIENTSSSVVGDFLAEANPFNPPGAYASQVPQEVLDRVEKDKKIVASAPPTVKGNILMGFGGNEQLANALRVLKRENPTFDSTREYKDNSDGSVDRGLFQINSKHFTPVEMKRREKALKSAGISNFDDMFDPELNARMAYLLWKERGWDAWYGAPQDIISEKEKQRRMSRNIALVQ